jgi:hypothetical protein
MYGNVGAADRLDFTVIGPAVNLVTRMEALARTLDPPLPLPRPPRLQGHHGRAGGDDAGEVSQ